VEPVDTEVVPDSGPTLLGRALWLGLPVLEQCCQALAKRRGQSSLPLEVKRTLSYARSRPRGGGESAGARRSERSAWAATVIEVELDPVTLQSFCRGVWMAVEAGRLWDPEGVGRVLRGEVTRALGFAALNEPTYPSGREGSVPVFHELLLGAQATPPVHVSLLENEAQAPKGYEQLPHVSIAPAYVAAVSQAAGVYLEQVPVYPEVVQQCLET
jgi:CO/xanthine dehydrogenase Mo-binding subunit